MQRVYLTGVVQTFPRWLKVGKRSGYHFVVRTYHNVILNDFQTAYDDWDCFAVGDTVDKAKGLKMHDKVSVAGTVSVYKRDDNHLDDIRVVADEIDQLNTHLEVEKAIQTASKLRAEKLLAKRDMTIKKGKKTAKFLSDNYDDD